MKFTGIIEKLKAQSYNTTYLEEFVDDYKASDQWDREQIIDRMYGAMVALEAVGIITNDEIADAMDAIDTWGEI